MASILKNGIILSNGSPNPNLIAGTTNEEIQYTYPSSNYSDKFSSTTIIVPSTSQYTLSFWAKSTVSGDKIRAHYYNPNTTTKCESSQGVTTTNSDGNIDIILSTSWTYYWIIYTQSSTTSVKSIIFPRLWSGQGTGTVSVKMVKFEEGNIPTVWIPCVNDSIYNGNSSLYEIEDNCKIQKNGYIQSKEFIEF